MKSQAESSLLVCIKSFPVAVEEWGIGSLEEESEAGMTAQGRTEGGRKGGRERGGEGEGGREGGRGGRLVRTKAGHLQRPSPSVLLNGQLDLLAGS
jgi:hypothetical protein